MTQKLLLACLLALLVNKVKAQVLYSLPKRANAVSVSLSAYRGEPSLLAGYYRSVHIKLFRIIDEYITLFGEFTDRSNLRNDNDFRFTYGGQADLWKKRNFRLPFRKTFNIDAIKRPDLMATQMGAEFELMPGIYKNRFFYALDLYFGHSFRARTNHTEYLRNVASNVEEGWLLPHHGKWHIGLNGGYTVGKIQLFGQVFFESRTRRAVHKHAINATLGVNYLF